MREGRVPSCLPETLKSISDAFLEKKKNPGLNTTEMLPVNCRRTRIWWRSRIFTHKLCDCDLSAVLYFSETKKTFFFSFTPPEFTASVTAENTLFYCSCWQKWMNLCLWHSVALSFSQFQVMPENFRSGGFSLQRFFFFLLFKTASVFFLALTSCITLVYADWARSAPVPSVKGLKALAQSSPATSLCLFSIVFCSVNICPLSSRSFL